MLPTAELPIVELPTADLPTAPRATSAEGCWRCIWPFLFGGAAPPDGRAE